MKQWIKDLKRSKTAAAGTASFPAQCLIVQQVPCGLIWWHHHLVWLRPQCKIPLKTVKFTTHNCSGEPLRTLNITNVAVYRSAWKMNVYFPSPTKKKKTYISIITPTVQKSWPGTRLPEQKSCDVTASSAVSHGTRRQAGV